VVRNVRPFINLRQRYTAGGTESCRHGDKSSGELHGIECLWTHGVPLVGLGREELPSDDLLAQRFTGWTQSSCQTYTASTVVATQGLKIYSFAMPVQIEQLLNGHTRSAIDCHPTQPRYAFGLCWDCSRPFLIRSRMLSRSLSSLSLVTTTLLGWMPMGTDCPFDFSRVTRSTWTTYFRRCTVSVRG
jgi:hypothetical protein